MCSSRGLFAVLHGRVESADLLQLERRDRAGDIKRRLYCLHQVTAEEGSCFFSE
jgi:hypothetical protein